MQPTCDDRWAGVSCPLGGEAASPVGDDVSGSADAEEPLILEEIEVEDLSVDGICGVY